MFRRRNEERKELNQWVAAREIKSVCQWRTATVCCSESPWVILHKHVWLGTNSLTTVTSMYDKHMFPPVGRHCMTSTCSFQEVGWQAIVLFMNFLCPIPRCCVKLTKLWTYSFQSTVQQTLVSSVSRMPMALILSKILSYDLSLPRYCLTEMCSACRYSGCDEAWQDHGVWESRLCTGGGRSHEGGQGSCGSPEALSCHVHAGLVWRPHMDRASRGHRCQVGSIVCSDLYSMFSAWSLFLYLHAYFTLPAPVAPQPRPPPPQHPQSSSLPCLVFQIPVLYLSSCTASQTSSRFCCCCNFLLVLIRRTSCFSALLPAWLNADYFSICSWQWQLLVITAVVTFARGEVLKMLCVCGCIIHTCMYVLCKVLRAFKNVLCKNECYYRVVIFKICSCSLFIFTGQGLVRRKTACLCPSQVNLQQNQLKRNHQRSDFFFIFSGHHENVWVIYFWMET